VTELELREAATKVLGTLRDPSTLDALLTAVRPEVDRKAASGIMDAFGNYGDAARSPPSFASSPRPTVSFPVPIMPGDEIC